jgi:hypothetical protein
VSEQHLLNAARLDLVEKVLVPIRSQNDLPATLVILWAPVFEV